MAKLKVTMKKSLIGRTEKQKSNIRALGLKRIGHTVIKEDNPQIRGMIKVVDFMLNVEQV